MKQKAPKSNEGGTPPRLVRAPWGRCQDDQLLKINSNKTYAKRVYLVGVNSP
jgi:hypothetical protein